MKVPITTSSKVVAFPKYVKALKNGKLSKNVTKWEYDRNHTSFCFKNPKFQKQESTAKNGEKWAKSVTRGLKADNKKVTDETVYTLHLGGEGE